MNISIIFLKIGLLFIRIIEIFLLLFYKFIILFFFVFEINNYFESIYEFIYNFFVYDLL